MIVKEKKYPRVTKGTAKEIEKMANDLIRDGYVVEKNTKSSERPVATIVIIAHNYKFRFWIDYRYGKGTLKVQPKR